MRLLTWTPQLRGERASGAWARQLPMPAWFAAAHAAQGPCRPACAAGRRAGQALSTADVASMVISAASDAQRARAAGIGWQALRDTAVDWLIGQGLPSYSELPKVVGRVDAEKLQALSSRHADTSAIWTASSC